MPKPKKCNECKGTGWVVCCDPPGHMCPGDRLCPSCEGSGKVIRVEEYKPYK